jgi:hypothetical protein
VRAGDVGDGSEVVDVVTGWSTSISTWITDIGALRLGFLLALGLAAVLTATFGVNTRRRS